MWTHEDEALYQKLKADEKAERKETRLGVIASQLPRSLVTSPFAAYDFLNTLRNLPIKAIKKFSNIPLEEHKTDYEERAKANIDKATKGYTKPHTNAEKLAEAAFDVIGPGKVKSLRKAITSRAPAVTGSVAGQAVLNENPESKVSALTASLGVPLALSGLGKAAKRVITTPHMTKIRNSPELSDELSNLIKKQTRPHQVNSEQAGKLAIESSKNYKKKADEVFGRAYEHVEKYLGKLPAEQQKINIENARNFGVEHLVSLTPELQKDYLKSAPGKVLKLLSRRNEVTPKQAQYLRKKIGNELSKASEIGTEEQGQLKTMLGLLIEDIGKKYKEVSPQAYRDWKHVNKHYGLHREKNVPIVNKILKEEHTPIKAFEESIKDIEKGAKPSRLVSGFLHGKQKQQYHQGIASELGKNGIYFDPKAFNKSFEQIPAKDKGYILRYLGKEAQRDLINASRETKTLQTIRKGKKDKEISIPITSGQKALHYLKKVTTDRNLSPKYIDEAYKELQKKTTKGFHYKEPGDKKKVLSYALPFTRTAIQDNNHWSDEDEALYQRLKKEEESSRSHFADGGNVRKSKKVVYDTNLPAYALKHQKQK